jgi:hypothetical protein
MVDGDKNIYCCNLVGLISAKYHSNVKSCGQHGGIVYFSQIYLLKKYNLSPHTYGGVSGQPFCSRHIPIV